jgi:hypothetical protein
LKLPKAEVSKPFIVIDREGGHASVDRELWEKEIHAKVSVDDLKLPKPEEPNW